MIVIIDVHNTLYAGYHAFVGKLTSNSKYNTTHAQAAIYGFFRIVTSRLKHLPHFSHVFLCFDEGQSFRYKLYPEYKSHRKNKTSVNTEEQEEIRKGIRDALKDLYDLQGCLPWYCVRRPDTEGDDLIAALCCQTYGQVHKQIISADKDILQLVNPWTTVWNRKTEITAANFAEQVSVKLTRNSKKAGKTTERLFFNDPTEWYLFRILTGDKSDSIPGIPGVGDATGYSLVRTLVKRYNGSIDVLLSEPERVCVAAKIRNAQKIASNIREDGHRIVSRNMTLMSLVEASDRVSNLNSFISVGEWSVGQAYFYKWLQDNKFTSLIPDIDLFHEMSQKNDASQ